MAIQVRAGQLFRYRSFHINKSQQLGHGAYGAVYKAKCDQLTCAAKVLHPTILDPLDPGAGKIMERFRQECAFLESIRHPNIVQYLGMTRDPESKLPVLLMELLDESLTKMLERSPTALPYFVEVDICHDIALAVAYLHSNNIIHRDLSSNNVLIMAKKIAKVTDFGMSRISSAAPTMTPLTMCPGTLSYMSPEALDEPPTYTKKLDCFSEGVMMIQVCTRLWPEPGPRTKAFPFAASPTGMTNVPVLEPERRQNHIAKIDRSHGLLPIAMDCLRYQEKERPSSEELCERLAGLKETREYRESMERVERQQNSIAELERQVQQLHNVNRQQVWRLEDAIHSKDSRVQQLQQQLQIKEERNEQLDKQLKEQEEITAAIQQSNNALRRQVEKLQQQPSVSQPSNVAIKALNDTLRTLQHAQQERMKPGEWVDGGRAPYGMIRGSSVVDGTVAYFMHWNGRIYAYTMHPNSSHTWSELPQTPFKYSSLSIVRGVLIAIGGQHRSSYAHYENKLYSILNDGDTWMEMFPPMPTKRCSTSAVSTKRHLIVAGGEQGQGHCLNKVEVMDIRTLAWSLAASLPHPYNNASATICGNRLYMLGGVNKDNLCTKSVLTCSLTRLLQSRSETSSHPVWKSIADTPLYRATCVAVDGELLAIGGEDDEDENKSDVYKYIPMSNSWRLVTNMPTPRHFCLVAVFPSREIVVVGGQIRQVHRSGLGKPPNYFRYSTKVENIMDLAL